MGIGAVGIKMEKINLMHIVYSLDTGGLEKLVVELVERVNSEVFNSSVSCLTGRGALSEKLEKNNIEVFYLNKKDGVGYLLPFRLSSLMKRKNIDIAHTHDSSANFYGGIAAKLAGVKVNINTEHGGIYFETKQKKLINRLLCHMNDCEICVSESIKKDLADMGLSKKKLRVIPNGIAFDKFDRDVDRRAKRNELGIKGTDFVITTVGRLSWEKGQELLLKAAPGIIKKVPNAKFLIVGDGPLRKFLENLAEKEGLGDRVLFMGVREDIPEILKTSDCYVLPSKYESFGLTILEAMAAGIPVVATDVGGVSEIVKHGETGLLISVRDSREVAEAVIRSAADISFSRSMAERAREMVRNRYRIEDMVKSHEDLYLNCYKDLSAARQVRL